MPPIRRFFPSLAVACASFWAPVSARTLHVGPGQAYAKPSLAAAAAQDGDTVEIEAGVYAGDACTWNADNLVIRGKARYAHMRADGAEAQGKGIWVIDGKNTTVENIEFSGAKVDDQNGAGIRQEGPGVTIRHCYFHDNENGILADAGPDITIEYTEFDHNGIGELGRTHNIYVSSASSFTLRYCYTHNAVIGHTVKSRALKNYILYNRIMDEDGSPSYEIDLPDGGESYIIGNLIQQGRNSDNPTMFSIGEESLKNPGTKVYLVNNTFVDELGGTYISIPSQVSTVKAYNNLFTGKGKGAAGSGWDMAGNVTTGKPAFRDSAKFDYRLTAASPAIDKGAAPGSAGGMDLAPAYQYLHPMDREARVAAGAIDAGAYEFNAADALRPRTGRPELPAARPALRWAADGAAGWLLELESRPGRAYNASGRRFRLP